MKDEKIYNDFVDWMDSLEKEPSWVQIWMEGFKRGMNFKADAEIQCPKCGNVCANLEA